MKSPAANAIVLKTIVPKTIVTEAIAAEAISADGRMAERGPSIEPSRPRARIGVRSTERVAAKPASTGESPLAAAVCATSASPATTHLSRYRDRG